MIAPPRPATTLTRAQRRERLAAMALLSVALGASFVLPPRRPLPLDACLLHRLTGLPCLTCGLTRAVCLFAHGLWRESLRMHPAGWLAFGMLLGSVLWLGAESLAAREIHPRLRGRLQACVVWSGLVLSAAAWLFRLADQPI